jgi:hypothetical protein
MIQIFFHFMGSILLCWLITGKFHIYISISNISIFYNLLDIISQPYLSFIFSIIVHLTEIWSHEMIWPLIIICNIPTGIINN